MKYIKNINPYIQNAASGTFKTLLSIICCPTFIISTTPIITTNEVVFIILVVKFTTPGIILLNDKGIKIYL